MKYLVIGDASSMHIYNFIKTVLLPKYSEIYLLTLSTEPVRTEYREFYLDRGVHLLSLIEQYGQVSNKTILDRMMNFWRKLLLLKHIKSIDICHLQSVYKTSCMIYLCYKKRIKKLIMSYWGGDIEDQSRVTLLFRKSCFAYADAITVTTKKTKNDFEDLYGDRYASKLHVCRFATAGLQYIHDIAQKESLEECRANAKIPEGKISITCGYSAYEAQHQDIIISKIAQLKPEMKKRIHLLVPMQYGRYNQEYIERVHEAAELCGCSYEILEKFVPFEISARMSLATDIYIHMRDTDAFSNALKEQVYAGAIVIQGAWLKYIELDEMGAPVIKVDSFDNLLHTLEKLLENFHSKGKTLFEPMYALYSPVEINKQWNKIIENVIQKG